MVPGEDSTLSPNILKTLAYHSSVRCRLLTRILAFESWPGFESRILASAFAKPPLRMLHTLNGSILATGAFLFEADPGKSDHSCAVPSSVPERGPVVASFCSVTLRVIRPRWQFAGEHQSSIIVALPIARADMIDFITVS